NKGIETVFSAVMRLRPKFPNIRLQVLGTGDDGLEGELRQRARREGAQANFEFHGFIDPQGLPQFYRPAHVFCSPAMYEGGVANVYLEAMASGCPVVASVAGGAPEAVTHEETGLLVSPGDADTAAAALDKILSDKALA